MSEYKPPFHNLRQVFWSVVKFCRLNCKNFYVNIVKIISRGG